MFNIFNTKTKNLKKLALVSGAMVGAMVIGATTANASTKIDQNHVRVEQGDTLSQIAFENGTTVDAIVQANHLTNPNMIFVGDNLILTPNADNNNNQSANVQPASQATDNVAPAQVTNTTNNQASQTSQAPVAQTTNATNNSSLAGNSAAEAISQAESGGSVHNQFIAAGGTEAMWNAIVIPESGGNPNAYNGQYRGLGQTNQNWGTGSVAEQTQGMIDYANSRYGSISNAINFRINHNFW